MAKNKKCWIDWITLILLIVGGLNWLLVGLFKLDIVQAVLGGVPILRDIIYILVGLSAIWVLIKINKI